jgi:ketosteroid isomerase-like protein
MPPSDVELIRDHYDATNERDFGRAMSHYDEDVVLVAFGGLSAGLYEGKEAVGRWFGDWFATFDPASRFEITELSQRDDGRVLLIADMHAVGRGSGLEVVSEVIWLYRIRDGKIVHVEGGVTRDVRAKLGLE